MNTLKIISLTHAEDLDGIGAQSIINRYFKILNKPIPEKFKTCLSLDNKNNNENSTRETNNEVNAIINLRAEYSTYLYYWAAIFAKNLDLFDKKFLEEQNLKGLKKDNFEENWMKICRLLLKISSNNRNPLDSLNPQIKSTILTLQEDLIKPDLIIITDLGFNVNFKVLFPYLKGFDCNIAYLDHHEQDEEMQEFFKSRCCEYIIDPKRCSAQIAKDYFLKDDAIANEIAFFGSDSDFQKFSKRETEHFQAIIGKNMYNYDVLDTFVNKFSSGVFLDLEFVDLYDEMKEWEKQQEEFIQEKMVKAKIKISNDDNVEFTFAASEMRPGRNLRYIERNYENLYGHNLCNHCNHVVNLLIGLNTITGKMNIKSNKLNVYNVAVYFKGGGHIERAGFDIPQEFIDESKNGNLIDKFDLDGFLKRVIEVIEKN